MGNFFAALTFLTILPGSRTSRQIGARTLPWFPAVGLIIGSLLFLFDLTIGCFFPAPARSLFLVLFLAVLTGGIHLDGLADTADGLFSHRGREEALRIMKTSDIGVMGAMALFFVLGLKWAALTGIVRDGSYPWFCLVLPPAYARAAMLFGTYFLPYAREEGTGRGFVTYREGAGRFLVVGPLLVLPLLAGIGPFLVINVIFLLVTAFILIFYQRKIGGITGDMLGALGEVVETSLFLTGVFLK